MVSASACSQLQKVVPLSGLVTQEEPLTVMGGRFGFSKPPSNIRLLQALTQATELSAHCSSLDGISFGHL